MTGGILVPIADTTTLTQTVVAAVGHARETETEIHLVRVIPSHHVDGVPDSDAELLDRAERAAIDAGFEQYETAILGDELYVAGPGEHCELLAEYATANSLERIVLDPQYSVDATDPTLQSIESILSSHPISFEYAAIDETGGITQGELLRGGLVAAIAFGFYIALGGPTSTFTLASGVVTALIAAVLLRNVAFETTPTVGESLAIGVRLLAFFPYLLWEIAKANVLFAYIVLHPSMPIDPRLDRVDAAVGSGQSVTALANTITLTPGTLTLDATGHKLLVHSMTTDAQDDVLDGLHERAVRFLFYGRAASELPGPRAREDYESITTVNGATESQPADSATPHAATEAVPQPDTEPMSHQDTTETEGRKADRVGGSADE